MIDLLIKNGADVKTKNDHGITPLMFAAKFGDLESVGVLIENGADINARDNDGKTAADYARENYKREKIPEILKVLGG